MRTDEGLFDCLFGRGGVDTGDAAWLRAMLDTEAALARALERAGLAAAGAGAAVTAAAARAAGTAGAGVTGTGDGAAGTGDGDRAAGAGFDAGELGRQAALTGNPVPPLVRALTSAVPGWAASAVHRGATSQDILDTAMMLLAKRAAAVVLSDLSDAATSAARLAEAHRGTIMIGRTLLQQAVPVTFGLVAAGWLTGIDEAAASLARVAGQRLAVQFGGAAGTLAALGETGPRVAALLAGELGLAVPVVPWHTDRLRVVELASAASGVTGTLGKIARDVTLLAQSEVAEVSEGGTGRGGSSAMPHKRNPVASVLILGCARRVPGLLATLAAAAEQEHQRAAGAWHAEWETLADLLRLTGSAASWAAELLAGLVVDGQRMRANLDAAGGFPMAEHVAGLLAPALGPVAAHDLVAAAAAGAAASGASLRDALQSGEAARSLAAAGVSQDQLDAALDPAGYLGAAGAFTDAALAAHRDLAARLGP